MLVKPQATFQFKSPSFSSSQRDGIVLEECSSVVQCMHSILGAILTNLESMMKTTHLTELQSETDLYYKMLYKIKYTFVLIDKHLCF